jgi:sugar phosphate isomerase/epimerase
VPAHERVGGLQTKMDAREFTAMQLLFFCPYWGHRHIDIETFARKVKDAGYDGIEMDLPPDEAAPDRAVDVLRDHDLALIAQHHETHLPDFEWPTSGKSMST